MFEVGQGYMYVFMMFNGCGRIQIQLLGLTEMQLNMFWMDKSAGRDVCSTGIQLMITTVHTDTNVECSTGKLLKMFGACQVQVKMMVLHRDTTEDILGWTA